MEEKTEEQKKKESKDAAIKQAAKVFENVDKLFEKSPPEPKRVTH